MKLSLRAVVAASSCLLFAPAALANGGGVAAHSGRPAPFEPTGAASCTACHTGGTTTGAFTGTGVNGGTLAAAGGSKLTLTFAVGGGGGGNGGVNIATDSPYAVLLPVGGTTYPYKRDELYHNGVGTRTWSFTVDVPNVTGSFKIYGTGLAAAGGTGGATGSAVLTVNATAAPGAPTALIPATLNGPAGSIKTKTASLSVLGGDNSPEADLKYTWFADGVTFSPNGTNAAKNTTATFSKAGTFNLAVNITDPTPTSTPSSVSVTVEAALGGVLVSPAEVTVAPGGTYQLTAKATDQFGGDIATQPTFTWTIATGASGGTVSATGLYKAPNKTLTSPVIIYATTSPYVGVANITVANGTSPKITGSISGAVNNLSATLAVTATDDGPADALIYEWSKVSGPGTATFSPNTTNAAKSTTATFSEAGNYRLQIRVKDAQNLPTSTFVDVNAGTYGVIGNGGEGGGTADAGTGGDGGGGAGGCSSTNASFHWAALALFPAVLLRRRARA